VFLALDCLHILPTMPPQSTPFEQAPPEPYTNNLNLLHQHILYINAATQNWRSIAITPNTPTADLALKPNSNGSRPWPQYEQIQIQSCPTRLTNIDPWCRMAPSSATLLCAHSLPLSSTQKSTILVTHPPHHKLFTFITSISPLPHICNEKLVT
jgi:hypothetical protein